MTVTTPDETVLTPTDFRDRLHSLQAKAKLRPRPEPTHPDWLERTFGVFADDPTWDEHLRFLEAQRRRDEADTGDDGKAIEP